MKKSIISAALVCAVMLISCGSREKGLSMGSLSQFDSLSYALGANIGYGLTYEMGDIPFNFKEVDKGIKEGAFDKASQEHEAAIDQLRDYFMNKRMQRREAIEELYAADSTLTRVKAHPDMFATESERDSLSYAFGQDIGVNVKESGMPIRVVWLIEAMKNVREENPKMSEDEVQSYLQYYFMVKRPAEMAEASEKWLNSVKKKSGVKETESGLLYKVTREGDSEVIATDPRDIVVVNYKGTNREGKVFDSSYDRGEPAEFPLNRVIAGWTEGLQLVGKGGAITLWIPSELAYGPRGAGRDIGPNEALCFEVEVIDVKPYVDPAAAETVAEPATEE